MTKNNHKKIDETTELLLRYCEQREYPAKGIIIKEGDPSLDLFYIISGSVTVIAENKNAKEIVLAYLNAGDYFGEIGLFSLPHTHSALVRAKTKCKIAKISYERLQSLHNILPKLLFDIASQLAFRLRRTSRKVIDLAFTDAQGRIARALLDLCKEPDAEIHEDGMQIRVTRKELGRIVGCSREIVGRVLKNLEENNLILTSGKSIVIFDVENDNKN